MAYQDKRDDCSETHSGCRGLRLAARHQGVTEEDNLPFMLCPPDATAAVLLVHGFTASPWEMRPLAEALAGAGIASLAIRLPGHGTSPEDLARRHWEEWLDAILEGHQILSQDFRTIYGMGMSTGCLLLLMMVKTAQVNGLVLFSPYLKTSHRLAPYVGLLRWIYPFQSKPAEKEASRHYYNRRPLAGIHQINRLTRAVRVQLAQVTCPVLAFNGEGDQTVDVDSGRQLVHLLGSPIKIYGLYGPDVPHVMTLDENPCRRAMFSQAVNFVWDFECLVRQHG